MIKRCFLKGGNISVKENSDGAPVYELNLKFNIDDVNEAAKFLTIYRGNPGNLEFTKSQMSINDAMKTQKK